MQWSPCFRYGVGGVVTSDPDISQAKPIADSPMCSAALPRSPHTCAMRHAATRLGNDIERKFNITCLLHGEMGREKMNPSGPRLFCGLAVRWDVPLKQSHPVNDGANFICSGQGVHPHQWRQLFGFQTFSCLYPVGRKSLDQRSARPAYLTMNEGC